MTKHVILFLAADPRGSIPLRVPDECAEIQRELQLAPYRDDFRFEPRWAVSTHELMRHVMELDPTVIHFSGHGARSSALILQDEHGNPQPVLAPALTMMLKTTVRKTRVVVLNACYTTVQAEALRAHIDCVIGMDGAVSDDAARAFAVQFYCALGNRRSIANAVAQGVAVLTDKPDGWLLRDLDSRRHHIELRVPRCVTRAGIDADKVLLEPFVAPSSPLESARIGKEGATRSSADDHAGPTGSLDVVLELMTAHDNTGQARWLVEVGTARARVAPLTDRDLETIPGLPHDVASWEGLLAHLSPNEHWSPDRRVMAAIGELIHQRMIVGDVADRIRSYERSGRSLRFLIHISDGEEDGLLGRLPFELLHHDSFWFRRPEVSGLRCASRGLEAEIALPAGAVAVVAWSSSGGSPAMAEHLASHGNRAAEALRGLPITTHVIAECSVDQLRAQLIAGVDLLYLICQGNEDLDSAGVLTLCDRCVSGHELGEWIQVGATRGRRLQAAFLCAHSAATAAERPGTLASAQHLAAGDRRAVAALGFRGTPDPRWALGFMTALIDRLAAGAGLERAFAETRAEQPVNDPQWTLPLLYVHERGAQHRHEPAHRRPRRSQLTSLLPRAPVRYFTARASELEALRAWLERPGEAVLTSLTGQGGIGKTEIACYIAHETAVAGRLVIWFTRAHIDLDRCLLAMIRLTMPEYSLDGATTEDLQAIVTRELAARSGLLVLDDLEDGNAVRMLTPGASWNVLVTTRDRRLLPGVEPVSIPRLEVSDALLLLARVVGYEGDRFPEEDSDAARRLIDALDCLPLAIEVVGAQLRRGDSIEDVLSGIGDVTAPVGKRIADTLERSLRTLLDPDRRAWMLVAQLPTVGANADDLALALGEKTARAARRMIRLEELHLVRRNAGSETDAGSRFGIHPLARAVALARAESCGLADELKLRAAGVVTRRVAWCYEPLGRDSSEARRRWREVSAFIDTLEIDRWPPGSPGADELAAALSDADMFRAHERSAKARDVYLEAAAARAITPSSRATMHRARGRLRLQRDDLEGAEQDYDRAFELFAIIGSSAGRASMHVERGRLQLRRGEHDSAEDNFKSALALRGLDDGQLGLAHVHLALGELYSRRHQLDLAQQHYSTALDLYRAAGDNHGLANAYRARGALRARRGDTAGAEVDYEAALQLFVIERSDGGQAAIHRLRGSLQMVRGRHESAARDFERALELFTSAGDNLGIAHVCLAFNELEILRSNLAAADDYLERAIGLYGALEADTGLADAYASRALLSQARGDMAGAESDLGRAIQLYRALRDAHSEGGMLVQRGDLRRRLDDLDGGAADYERAISLFTRVQSMTGLASALRSRAELAMGRGSWVGAHADLARAHELFTKSVSYEGLASVHYIRGTLHKRCSELEAAEREHQHALVLFEHLGDHVRAAAVLTELADTAARRGDHSATLGFCERAERYAQPAGLGEIITTCAQLRALVRRLRS